MRIGFYCGLANNMYVFATSLAAEGVDVCFIRDRSDRYPMSQPVWEDIPFRLGYSDVLLAASWEWHRWTQLERDVGWKTPDWLADPLTVTDVNAALTPPGKQDFLDSSFLRLYVRERNRTPVLQMMKSCDALFVSGIEGSVLAYGSGVPYIIFPFGGDLMVAAGLFKPKLHHVRLRFVHAMVRRQLVAAYRHAACIASHEPTALATDFYGSELFLRQHKLARIPMPFAVRERGDPASRRQQMECLLEEMGIPAPSGRLLGFVPSRIDYEWKGQDRLLRALAGLVREGKASEIHLVFSGWGKDFEQARKFVQEKGLAKQCTFLDCALSKPLLYRFYLSADFVVDQFIVGMCGTSALEAMACAAPLVTWINSSVERSWGMPPVLQARTEDEIAVVLSDISEGRIDLDAAGTRVQEWMARNYHPRAATDSLLAAFTGK